MIEFFIPLLPGQGLNPNGRRPHWTAILAARTELREATRMYLRFKFSGMNLLPINPARVTLTLRQTKQRRRDGYYRPEDIPNASYALKPVYDGIEDAGLILDDTAEHMPEAPVHIEWIEDYDREGIAVRVEPAGEQAHA